MDTHPPQGIESKDEKPCHQPYTPHMYSIPLRSMISRNISNLMFAGRNLSATHIAFSSTRVMATCAVMGEGLGTFAATAIRDGLSLEEAAQNKRVVHEAQQQLLRQGAFLPGRRLEHSLADQARVSASSAQSDGLPVNTVDGETRAVHGEGGVRTDLTSAGTHRWMSRTDDQEPWLQLDWDTPIDATNISVTLDTGLHRWLTLSPSDKIQWKMIWGEPQPETLKEFKIIARDASGSTEIAHIKDNYQRQLDFKVELNQLTMLKLEVISTNGLDHARVVELRCY